MPRLDKSYDPQAGYQLNLVGSALRHETRSSAYYVVGLLARNERDDVEEAEKVIKNIISGQFEDPKEQWSV